MTEEFILPIKAFSINKMYYRDRAVKTTEARQWTFNVFDILSQPDNEEKLANLREFFDKKKHAYTIEMTAYYPEKYYFTKAGDLSSRTFDISNWEKPLIDLIFLPKYFKQLPPTGCKNLNVDDRYLKKMVSEKLPSDTYKIHIKLQIESI